MIRSPKTETTGRRFFVTGHGEAAMRPPWSTEQSIRENCTSCGTCVEACPEGILSAGPAGTPVIDFSENACSFCQKCVSACDEHVFASVENPPWDLKARIQNNCMLKLGISCQICADACLDEAMRFDMSHAPSGAILINTEACTGCGACLSVCPSGAISFKSVTTEAEYV